ncbi:MAG: GIN domain-containing protein [Luteibaculum sp.]
MRYIAFLLFSVVVASSCRKSGEEIELVRFPGAFHSAVFLNNFEIFIGEDSTYRVEMLGVEQELSKIELEIKDSVLHIKNTAKLKWTRPGKPVQLRVFCPDVKRMVCNETSMLKSLHPLRSKEIGVILTSKANEVDLELDNEGFYYYNHFPCGGMLRLRGRSEKIKIWNYAIMTVDAKDLEVQEAQVENYAKTHCYVNVQKKLDYILGGEGDIVLFGNPQLRELKPKSGSGKLIFN